MFCNQCGKEISNDSKFCPLCGKQLLSQHAENNEQGNSPSSPETRIAENDISELDYTASSKKNSVKMFAAIGTAVICCLVFVLVFSAILLKSKKKTALLQQFQQEISEYQTHLSQLENGTQIDYFNNILKEAQVVLTQENMKQIPLYEEQIAEANSKIDTMALLQETTKKYTEEFQKYNISDTYVGQYNTIMQEIESAMSSGNTSKLESLKEKIAVFKNDLIKNNQEQVESLKQQIATIDVSNASDAEKIILNNYSSGLSEQLQQDKYAEALSTLDAWLKYATAIKNDTQSQKINEIVTTTIIIPESAYYTEFVIPDSSYRYLDVWDVAGLTDYELQLARNEIYARHGRKFSNTALQNYFNEKYWYSGTIAPENFDTSILNKYEKANIAFIKSYES